jgi:hypothetical protein
MYYEKLQHAAQGLGVKFEVKPIGGNTSIDWLQFFDAIVANVDKLKIDMLIEDMYSCGIR